MEFFHPMFTRNGMRNLKEIKRGNQSSKTKTEHEECPIEDSENLPYKRQRVDYSAFKTDVSRLQKNLEEFEFDLKQHTLQVQQKLAYILSALDETAVPDGQRASPPSLPGSGGGGIMASALLGSA